MSVHDRDTRERILSLLKKKQYRLFESQRDLAKLEKRAKMFVQGIIGKATKHIESGGEIKRVMLRRYDSKVGYEWDKFRINGVKVRFKVMMQTDEEEMLLIISCKEE